jgi:cell division protein FtsB
MSLVKLLNWFVFLLIIIALYNFFFGIDSKKSFSTLQLENQKLLERNQVLSQENNLLETGIQSRQKNDAHAEKFAREELNLIYEDEQYLSFEEINTDEPKR